MFADHFVNQTNKEAQWAGEHGFGQKNIPGINHKILILEKHATKGSFNNYVDKMGRVGGQKMPIFVQVKGKKRTRRERYSKKGKMMST